MGDGCLTSYSRTRDDDWSRRLDEFEQLYPMGKGITSHDDIVDALLILVIPLRIWCIFKLAYYFLIQRGINFDVKSKEPHIYLSIMMHSPQ